MIFNQKIFPNSIHIVFDGKKFFSLYEKDFNQLNNKESLEIWETWSQPTETLKETIKIYNEIYL